MNPEPVLTAIDLCAGAGGWIEAARGLPIKFVLAVDFAIDCCETIRYNHPGIPVVCADVTAGINYEQLAGKVDLVLGAVPCEEVSTLRVSRPTSAADMAVWHDLIDGLVDAVDTIAPDYWAMENVIQMRRHLPPLVPQVVLESRHWSAQSRKRLFIGNFPVPQIPPQLDTQTLSHVLMAGPHTVTTAILHSTHKSRRQWYSENTRRVLNPASHSPTVTDFGSRHSRGFVVPTPDGRERVMTLQEAARLQGFPESYIFVCAPSRAFKMVGQAVQIDTARAILESIVAAHRATLATNQTRDERRTRRRKKASAGVLHDNTNAPAPESPGLAADAARVG